MIDDSIRRSDVIDELMHIIPYKRYHNGEYILLLNKRECLSAIKAIPSADRPQEWIPCSERLPEEKEAVAVIIKQWDTGEIKKGITYRVDRNMWVGFGRYNEACVWWLPLPPWKGADDE